MGARRVEARRDAGRDAADYAAAQEDGLHERRWPRVQARNEPQRYRRQPEEAAHNASPLGTADPENDHSRYQRVLRGWPHEADQGHDEAHRLQDLAVYVQRGGLRRLALDTMVRP